MNHGIQSIEKSFFMDESNSVMRKSRILTFLFALWPGAGQMYLGYMKRGVSLMGLFFLIFAIMGFLGLSFLAFLLPIIWFYAFFDTMNLRSMSYEFLPQDDFLFHLDSINAPELVKFFQRRHLLAGVLLILVGIYILLHTFVVPIFYFTFNINLYPLFEGLPTLIVAVGIILLGIYLIRSTVSHKAIEDDYQEYHQDSSHQENQSL